MSAEKAEMKETELKKESNKQDQSKGDIRLESVPEHFDAHQIIKYPLSTEKSIRQMEYENKLVFTVHPRAVKADVKRAVEELFKVKVIKVNIQNAFTGKKLAYVRLGPESLASDVGADLGLI